MKKSELKPAMASTTPVEGDFSLIPRDKLLDLYAAMLKCRTIAAGLKNPRSRSFRTSEALTAGVTIDLLPGDAICPPPADLAAFTLNGASFQSLSRWRANPAACISASVARPYVVPPSASPAARFEAACRLAAHFRSEKSGSVVVYCIEPDTSRSRSASTPQLFESCMRRAADERLPILFVRQSATKSRGPLSATAQCGVPLMVVDRDDVIAVYRVASEALAHARRGNGPTLIDAGLWRIQGRTGKPHELRDPIRKLELYLAGKKLEFRSFKSNTLKRLATELGHATKRTVPSRNTLT